MSTDLALLIWLTESTYNGRSFNGPSLVETLSGYSLDQVVSTETFEGYTIYGVVWHLMLWKQQLARALGSTLDEVLSEESDFAAPPEDLTQDAWKGMLAQMDAIHAAYVAALKAFPAERLGEKMPWGCSYGEGVAWMATHDTYHTAMIRNMGVK